MAQDRKPLYGDARVRAKSLRAAAMEAELAEKEHELVDVTVKLPAKLRNHLASICARNNLKLDDIVSNQLQRWLLGQTITLLEASAEDEKPKGDGEAGGK